MGLGIPPILAASTLIAASGAAASVVKGVSGAFTDLLRAAIKAPAEEASNPTAENSVGATSKSSGSESLQEQTDEAVHDLTETLKRLLAENGIDVSGDIALQLDALGTIRVDGSHPEAALIETLLAREIDLTNQFREVAARTEYLQRVKNAGSAPPPTTDAGDATSEVPQLRIVLETGNNAERGLIGTGVPQSLG